MVGLVAITLPLAFLGLYVSHVGFFWARCIDEKHNNYQKSDKGHHSTKITSPPGDDHISHQTGSWENHRLKSAKTVLYM